MIFLIAIFSQLCVFWAMRIFRSTGGVPMGLLEDEYVIGPYLLAAFMAIAALCTWRFTGKGRAITMRVIVLLTVAYILLVMATLVLEMREFAVRINPHQNWDSGYIDR